MGILFIDVDGTLLTSGNTITGRTKGALRAASAAGHKVVLCSGRCLDGLAPIMDELAIGLYASTLNGACIFDMDGRLLSASPLSPESVGICQRLAGECSVGYLYFFSSHWGAGGMNSLYEMERDIVGVDGAAEPADVMAGRTDVHKFLAVGETSRCRLFLEKAGRLLPGHSIAPSSSRYVEVNAPGINKGYAVRTLCRLLGIDVSGSIGFGDYDNDLEMFSAVGHSVAMGNAPEHVKRKASEVCLPNDEDGLALWIEGNLLR